MSHLLTILIASAAFACLFAFIEFCDRLTPADGAPTQPAPQEDDR